MSLGSLGMARSAPATALLLLLLHLLLHVTQGQQGVEMFHHEKMEVTEGQDVALPCILGNSTEQIHVVNTEWKKGRDEATKLLVYNPKFGSEYFRSNINLQIQNNSMDSHLILHGVTSTDSGIYICVLSTYPLGNIIRETELKIRGPHVEVMCNNESQVEVRAGENVTIRCKATPGSRYMWTKNNSLVSENASLELWRVTEAHAGLYNLTVHTGGTSQHKWFFITVLRATTSRAVSDPGPVPPRSTSASEVTAAATHLTMSTPANVFFTTDVTRNTTTAADVTDNLVNVTARKNVTSQPTRTQPGTTSAPPTYTEHHPTGNSSDRQINQTLTSSTSTPFTEKVPSSDPSAGYTTVLFNSTQGASNQSEPEVIKSTSLEWSTQVGFTRDSAVNEELPPDPQSRLLLLLLIVPLILIAVVGFHYGRQIMKKRMDLPPPFKPPPPPVKYTGPRHRDTSTESAPWCNGTIA
ncbi:uncharacterized protein LOC142891792 isoform X2 [Nelusetta ayraudi]|uniref:uncharacterized protein LOC142891792 isoform X2 n=1 Tax=Nelusetta ayraudi TaxID=303726 RepID=UPI003F6FE963